MRANDAARLLEKLKLREEPLPADVSTVRRLVADTEFFRDDEVEIAVELVQERLTRGAASGYEFLFGEHRGEVIGYTCFGPIPATQSSYDLYWIAVSPRAHSGRARPPNGFERPGLGRSLE